MAMMVRPTVSVTEDGGKYWEHEYDTFFLKMYLPHSEIRGEILNYTFRAPLLLVFEERKQTMADAIAFAKEGGLERVAADADAGILFIYPKSKEGWKDAPSSLYGDIIQEVKMNPDYRDGIVEMTDFFTREFKGYFIRGAIFRADIYSFGESADYVAQNLLTTVQGEYLWGPGEITPAMCSMERLSVMPRVDRTDIGILSVGNSREVNQTFEKCEHLLIKDRAEYEKDFSAFVWKFKMWCGNLELEPDFEALGMVEETGIVTVKTAPDHMGRYKDTEEHEAGYFAYYNKGLFDEGPVPLLMGFHGGGDSSLFFTFVTGWYEIAHRYGFLFVAPENHQNISATEMMQIIEEVKKKYPVDEHRIYCTGFSMGSGKTWDMYQQYPEAFAGMAPASALFPVKNNPFSPDLGDGLNRTVAVPLFYSGGENSHLPELPFQAESALDRIQYATAVNGCRQKFDKLNYDGRESWENSVWGISGERSEVLTDESRGSKLTIQYFDSEDGVCRTALASISGQVHECRHHTCENAWKFISQFTR